MEDMIYKLKMDVIKWIQRNLCVFQNLFKRLNMIDITNKKFYTLVVYKLHLMLLFSELISFRISSRPKFHSEPLSKALLLELVYQWQCSSTLLWLCCNHQVYSRCLTWRKWLYRLVGKQCPLFPSLRPCCSCLYVSLQFCIRIYSVAKQWWFSSICLWPNSSFYLPFPFEPIWWWLELACQWRGS